MSVRIHPTAIVEKGAEIGENVTIGAYSFIGAKVRIEDHTEVHHHVSILGRTKIGRDNRIHSFATLGSQPQDLKYKGEDTALEIGDRNSIREYVNISLGTVTGTGKTIIGNGNLLMVYVHIAHDCDIGNETIIVNSVALAGHVTVQDKAVLGGLCAIHQFCKIGALAMVACGAMVAQDVLPYTMVHGDRARPNGLNVVGLRRIGISSAELTQVKDMYRIIYQENLTIEDALRMIEQNIPPSSYRDGIVSFARLSERGLCR